MKLEKGMSSSSSQTLPRLFTLIALFTFVYICWLNIDLPIKINVNISLLNVKNVNHIDSDLLLTEQTIANKFDLFTNISKLKVESDDPLTKYFDIHKRISQEKNVSLRKIFFSIPYEGGYGNRMYTFLSSTLIAILLECQLVLNWKTKELLYIEPPIDLFDKINISAGFESSNNSSNIYYFPHPKFHFQPQKNIKLLLERPYFLPETYMRYAFNSGKPLFTEISANTRYYEKFKYYELAREETLNRALNVLKAQQNYSNEELQGRVLDVAFEIGGNILNRIWRPNKDIQKEINGYMDKWFKTNYVIGLQMRASDSNYIDETIDYFKFINCALEIEREYILGTNQVNTSFKWFIATDSDKIRRIMFSHYGNKSFTSNGTLDHSNGGSREGFRRTVLDVELLSRCNEIIVTGGSTFGWMAAMKMLKMPYYINGIRETMVKCSRADLGHLPVNPGNIAPFR